MCIETLTPNKPLYTLTRKHGNDIKIATFNKRPILTTDYEALIQFAAVRVKMHPTATYTISKVLKEKEM